jgi:hypothetical protein
MLCSGTFGISNADYGAEKDSKIRAVVTRRNGTSGSIVVGVTVTEPDTVLLQCSNVADGGCHCMLYLTSSGVVSEPCRLTFIDGQEAADVTFSRWNAEFAELLPSQIVVEPFGAPLSDNYSALLHTDARQDSGFASFSVGPSEVLENASFAMVHVVRLNGTTGNVTFGFETFDITATAGEDYVPATGKGVLLDQQSSTEIWIQVIDNYFINDANTFGVRLIGQSLLTDSDHLVTHQVTIRDDESIQNAVPRMIDSISVIYTTGGEFQVGWSAAVKETAPISGYFIRVAPASANAFSTMYSTTLPQFTLSGLSARSMYNVEVAAKSDFGVGEFSEPFEVVTTDVTPPSAPVLLTATEVTNIKFTLTWEAPRDDGGSAIMEYRLSIVDLDGNLLISESVDALKKLFVVSNLYASRDYVCYLSSIGGAFPDNVNTESTTQITVSTPDGEPPGQPPAATLLGQHRGGALQFSMQRPQYTGGMALTLCSLFLRKTSSTDSAPEAFTVACDIELTDSAVPTCTITNLLASSSYEVYSVFSNRKVRFSLGFYGDCFRDTTLI